MPRSLRLSLSSLHSPCFSFLIPVWSWWRLNYSCFTFFWLSCIQFSWSTLLPWSIVYFHPPHWTVCTGAVGVALSTRTFTLPFLSTLEPSVSDIQTVARILWGEGVPWKIRAYPKIGKHRHLRTVPNALVLKLAHFLSVVFSPTLWYLFPFKNDSLAKFDMIWIFTFEIKLC